jgi:hypothetical protein
MPLPLPSQITNCHQMTTATGRISPEFAPGISIFHLFKQLSDRYSLFDDTK